MKRTLEFAILALAVASAPAIAEDTNCYKVSETVSKAITAKSDQVLQIVGQHVAASPACSCEVVKAAIVASEADRKLVGQIVAAAIEAAPDKMRTIANCAIAVAPDALADIQAILAKLEPQSGEGPSAKGGYAKGGKEPKGVLPPPEVRSPLDGPYLVPGEPFIHPPFVTPPSVSVVDDFDNVNIRRRLGGVEPEPEPEPEL